jgi:microcystin-dependent protein
MAKRICLLNGENDVQDYDINQFFSENITPGILKPTHFAITPQGPADATVNVAPGICLIEVTRDADQKTFNMFAESNDIEIVTVTGTGGNIGAIIAAIPKTNVQDGNPNPEDGTGVFDIVYIEGVGVSPLTDNQINSQTSDLYFWIRLANITQDPTVAGGDISDQRTSLSLNYLESIQANTISEKDSGHGVEVDNFLFKDGAIQTSEIATPSNPPTDSWKFYFKTSGPHVLDDAGVETKVLTEVDTIPIGLIVPYGGTTAPNGWLLCDGTTINASVNTQYQPLFNIIGNAFGGANNTNFKVPDMRGNFPLGKDNMGGSSRNRVTNAAADTLGSEAGAETHTLTVPEIPSHTHKVGEVDADNGAGGASNSWIKTGATVNSGSTGGGEAHNNMSPYITLNYIIKY